MGKEKKESPLGGFPFLRLFIKFAGDGFIIYNEDDAMLATADGTAQTFPIYGFFDGFACGDCFCGITLPLGDAGTDIFYPSIVFPFLEMKLDGIQQDFRIGVVGEDEGCLGGFQGILF